jgi:uridylate kinase
LKVVVKVGGFAFSNGLKSMTIASYAEVFERLCDEGHRMVAVAGGGEEARRYIKVARELCASEYACDILGIEASRMNARLLIAALRNSAYPMLPKTIQELQIAFETGKIIVMGGTEPGQSTNAVAALGAEALRADILVNATNVEGVYTSDPKKNPEAKKLDEISTEELLNLVLDGKMGAGSYELFDPVAIKIVERSKTPTRIIDGRIPENIEKAVKGEAIGTLLISGGKKGQ